MGLLRSCLEAKTSWNLALPGCKAVGSLIPVAWLAGRQQPWSCRKGPGASPVPTMSLLGSMWKQMGWMGAVRQARDLELCKLWLICPWSPQCVWGNTKCTPLGAPTALSQIHPSLFLPSFRSLAHARTHLWLTKKSCFRKCFKQSQLLTDESPAGGEGRRDTAPPWKRAVTSAALWL